MRDKREQLMKMFGMIWMWWRMVSMTVTMRVKMTRSKNSVQREESRKGGRDV